MVYTTIDETNDTAWKTREKTKKVSVRSNWGGTLAVPRTRTILLDLQKGISKAKDDGERCDKDFQKVLMYLSYTDFTQEEL